MNPFFLPQMMWFLINPKGEASASPFLHIKRKGRERVAGIGEYVHYRVRRYKLYGIGRSNVQGLSLVQSYKQAHSEILSNVTKTKNPFDLVSLEQSMNENFELLSKKTNVSSSEETSLEQEFKELVEKKIEEKKGHSVNWNDLSVSSLGSLFNQAKMKYAQDKTKDGYFQQKTWNKFQQLVEQSKIALQQAISKGSLSQGEATHLQKGFEKIDQTILLEEQNIANYGIKRRTKKLEKLFQRYNNLISGYELPSKKEFGDVGEFVADFCLLKAAGYANEEVSKMIKKAIASPLGAQRTSTSYDFSGLIEENDLKEIFSQGFNIQKSDGGRTLTVTNLGSQDTVDIQVKFSEKDILNGSVKNVSSLNKPISILGGMPFTALFNLVNTDFVNHYMNLLSFSSDYSNWINEKANPLWEKAELVRGLMGQRGKSSSNLANIFIVFDRSSQKFRLFSIPDILFKSLWGEASPKGLIQMGAQLPTSVENNFEGNASTPSYNSAGKRIAKIISQLHRIKLSASLTLTDI